MLHVGKGNLKVKIIRYQYKHPYTAVFLIRQFAKMYLCPHKEQQRIQPQFTPYKRTNKITNTDFNER